MLGAMGLPPGAVMQIALGVANAKDLDYVQGEVEALLRQRHKLQPGAGGTTSTCATSPRSSPRAPRRPT
jgi:hypothetical protein